MSLERRPGARSPSGLRLPPDPRGVALLTDAHPPGDSNGARRVSAARRRRGVELKGFVVLLVLVGLSACASGPYWTKAGASRVELVQDDGVCTREASEATPRSVGRGGGQTGRVWVNHWRYTDCMRAKGYTWASE
jgi:hypothetical protein